MSSKGSISNFFKPRSSSEETEEILLLSSEEDVKPNTKKSENIDLDSSSDGEGEDILIGNAPKPNPEM